MMPMVRHWLTGRPPHQFQYPVVIVLEVPELNSTRKLVVLALGLVALIAACEEDVTVEPPGPPPQIALAKVYAKTTNSNGVQNGLPSNDVYAFHVVSNGEFWVGTAAGVAKFPSTSSTTRGPDDVVTEITGLPHPLVKCFAEYGGKVYVGTWGGGLGVYDIALDTWTQVRPASTGLTDGFISEIAVSPEDLLYMATNDGVFIYDPVADTFTHFSTVDTGGEIGQLQALVSSVEVTEDAGVVQRWYGPRVEVTLTAAQLDYHGITVSKSASTVYKYTQNNSGLSEANVNDIYYDAVRGTYFVAYVTRGIGEVDVDASTWRSHTLVNGLPSNTVYSVTRATDGKGGTTMWAATQNGLAKLAGNNWQAYGKSGGLPSERTRRVYSDNGVRLWVAMVNGGAVRIVN
jgi:ligand-binding sensor domain-containing protein